MSNEPTLLPEEDWIVYLAAERPVDRATVYVRPEDSPGSTEDAAP